VYLRDDLPALQATLLTSLALAALEVPFFFPPNFFFSLKSMVRSRNGSCLEHFLHHPLATGPSPFSSSLFSSFPVPPSPHRSLSAVAKATVDYMGSEFFSHRCVCFPLFRFWKFAFFLFSHQMNSELWRSPRLLCLLSPPDLSFPSPSTKLLFFLLPAVFSVSPFFSLRSLRGF